MRTIDPSSPALRLVAKRAAMNVRDLDNASRALLLDGLAQILSDGEAEIARHTAFMIRESERQQFELFTHISKL